MHLAQLNVVGNMRCVRHDSVDKATSEPLPGPRPIFDGHDGDASLGIAFGVLSFRRVNQGGGRTHKTKSRPPRHIGSARLSRERQIPFRVFTATICTRMC